MSGPAVLCLSKGPVQLIAEDELHLIPASKQLFVDIKYAGLEANEAKLLWELESENNKHKHLLVDKLLEVEPMKYVLSQKTVTPDNKKPCATAYR